MEYPYFPLYVKDFIIGTIGMTTEEVGGYFKLLLYQWDKGGIPDDKNEVLKISGLKNKSFDCVVKKFNRCEDGLLKNERLEIVRDEVASKYATLRTNGAKGGRPPKKKNKPNGNQTETNRFLENNQTETNSEPDAGEKENQNQIENQIDTNVSSRAPVLSDNRPGHAPQFQAVWEFFSQMGKTEQQAIDFFNHYEGLGWMQGISKIVSWRSFANKWVSNPISKREEQKQSTGRMVIVEDFNGVQHRWTEEKWEQYRNNPSASGYEFVRYE